MLIKRVNLGVIIFSLVLVLSACAASDETPTSASSTSELRLYYWPEYLPSSILEDFTQEFGVKVNYLGYESGIDAIENIRSGQSFDLVILAFDEIGIALSANLAQPLDYGNIPNAANISPAFRDLVFDPGGRYTIPYDWGTMGIVLRTDRVQIPVTSWQDLWSEDVGGKIVIWDIPRAAFSPALMKTGHSINTSNPAEIEDAYQSLLLLSDRTVLVPSDAISILPYLEQEQVVAGIGYAYDALYAQQEGLPVAYVMPTDGVILWGESMFIPTTAQNKYAAELFINYILRPEVSAQITNEYFYATPVHGTDAFILPDLLRNPIIFPSQADLTISELETTIDETTLQLYTDYMNQWKSSIR
ncbi:MAG TPA: spermidine/putrescine ABC transporter substrate-binding protein [Anaerolineales bacterium]|nr:spermidine/putrescine ABC transporter substrate-binding protein [Anaerolineales bacterium]